jgi:hypothetical protein
MAGQNHIYLFHGVLTHTRFWTHPLFRMSFLLYRAVRLLVNRYHAERLPLPTRAGAAAAKYPGLYTNREILNYFLDINMCSIIRVHMTICDVAILQKAADTSIAWFFFIPFFQH